MEYSSIKLLSCKYSPLSVVYVFSKSKAGINEHVGYFLLLIIIKYMLLFYI